MEKMLIGKGTGDAYLLSDRVNQHGLISGATGSGKTVTLKVIAEQLSALGVPTVIQDVKGDLSNISVPGAMNDKLAQRLEMLGINEFSFSGFPVEMWDVFGETGLPLRVTVTDLGPTLLSQILNLNEVQGGILNILFKMTDKEGLLLLDLKDLRSALNYMIERKDELSREYGNISAQSVQSILRALLTIEDEGGDIFLGEPGLEITDMLRTDANGRGVVNIIQANRLIQSPTLYATFLLWMISEIYESLPEVGNLDKPKLVFFFDEAHLLFNGISSSLEQKILQTVRLIRSKGVGIFFITQNPLDIPDSISSQLGNRVVHQLRAFSPKDEKAVKSVADTFRANPNLNTYSEILGLRTGEAVISFLNEDGAPAEAEKAMILPPKSSFTALDSVMTKAMIMTSPLYNKYKACVDRESAYEMLNRKILEREQELEAQRLEAAHKLELEQIEKAHKAEIAKLEKEKLKAEKEAEKASLKKAGQVGRPKKSVMEKGVDSFMGSVSRTVGREIARNVFGSLLKR